MDWSKEKNTDQANLFAKPRLILRSTFPFSEVRQVRARRFQPVSPHRHVRRRHGIRTFHPDGER